MTRGVFKRGGGAVNGSVPRDLLAMPPPRFEKKAGKIKSGGN